jgi:dTDP-4-amino-4,6-dideoxygalactose transaminase
MQNPRIYLSPPHVNPEARELLLDAFDSNWIAPLGPHVDAFEAELAACAGTSHAVALASGTAGLHLALRILDVGPGDEVLVSTLTFVATANVVRYVGAEPVFIDSSADTWTMDPNLLEEELWECAQRGKLPKAVVVVDIYGQCADYDAIASVCSTYGVAVIEDAAESLGATYRGKPAGSLGDLGVFSFNGNKIITTSGGGALVSNRKEPIDLARFLSTQARDPAPHYQHSLMGYNYRMSNLLAAVGRGQLRVLPERVRARRAIYHAYRERLKHVAGISWMPVASYGKSTCWLTCMVLDVDTFGATPEQVRRELEAHNIESRPVWKPMHLQPLYANARTRGGAVTESLFATALCLPSGSNLSSSDLDRICDIIACVSANQR